MSNEFQKVVDDTNQKVYTVFKHNKGGGKR